MTFIQRVLWALAAFAACRPIAIIAAIGVLHRVLVLVAFRHVLIDFAALRDRILVMQLLPLDVLRQHFWTAMLLLQQSPPLPLIITKIILMIGSWPSGFVQMLCALNGAISIATACLLYGILRRVTANGAVAFLLALWFLLSSDLLVLEYDFFGEAFYENLAMLCVTASAVVLLDMDKLHGGMRRAAALGVLVSLAALSRSSLSYFALAPFVVGFGRWRGRWMAAYLAPVLLLQGGWSLKNAAVYGGFSWETSSWSGYNLAIGLADDRQLPLLCADIAASPTGTYPDWFLSMNRVCPPPAFVMGENGVTAYVVAQDAAARARLGGIDLGLNSLAVRMKSVQYKRAFTRYVLHHPASFARRFADGYHVLWQRIGDYGAIFVDPLFVVPADRGLFDLFSRGFGEHQRAMLSRADIAFVPTPPVSRKARFGTISLAPLDAASIAVLHGVFPLLALADLWRRLRGRTPLLGREIWLLAAICLYGLLVFTIGDMGENMRFRLAIEPPIIALTAACLAALARLPRYRPHGVPQPIGSPPLPSP